jgi:hypothetical protein
MATLTLKLPEHLNRQLATTARRRGVSRSQLVREAIERSLNVLDAAAGTTCLDLAGDLVGSHSGPPDLSYDPKHMKGYGR